MDQDLSTQHSLGDRLRAAIDVANIPTLACVLVHLTGERRWIEGRFRPTRTRGLEDNDSGGFSKAVAAEIKDAATEALAEWFAGRPPVSPNLPDEMLVEMMGTTLGEKIPSAYAPMIRHELQLPPFAAVADRTTVASHSGEMPPGFSAIIVGAGISGLCAAVEFEAAGIPYAIIERQDSVGGVWSENRYPGAACDVPSHLYSFSFKAFDWSRYFASRGEIRRYLDTVADEFAIRSRIRFSTEVVEARYDETSQQWEVDVITDGRRDTLKAAMLISAVGAFNKPRFPKVPGLERFEGPSVHTADYPTEGIDLVGKRVVLIGNGASAMQVAPAIADDVASLTILQRSPQWIAPFPKFQLEVPEALQWLLREVPIYRLWYRLRLSWAFNDKQYEALQQDPKWDGGGRSINAANDSHRRGLTAYLEQELADAQHLIPQVLPQYPPFGKRMLLDNGWFRTIAREHVQIISAGVTEVRERSVVLDNGSEISADVLIWATGFDVVNFLSPMVVRGVGGREIHDDWNGDDARAYLGTVVPGYPNFFCLYGPNTQFGHGGSLITILERQMHYVMSLLRQMFEQGIAAVDVREDVYDEYNRKVDDLHARMVWTYPGVETYYKNSRGRVVVNNPFRILDFWRMTETANLDDYVAIAQHGPAMPSYVSDDRGGERLSS